ncbi:cell division protein FtsL [Neofamilia massiliensis]|uniref:cell division protein FtsL n=1 Tax=Neofamilia massiliensis TaxID=1673724 RepID=UPI0006BB6212|nr:cell division protein FtsL [Neofamilia massiliensis]
MAEAARKLEYLEDYENYTEPEIKVHNNSQNNINSKYIRRRKVFLKIVYSSFLFVLLASAIFILSNYTKITALNVEIRKLDAKIEQVEKEQMNLRAEIEKIKSERDIVHEARTKLGMVYPDKSQIVYFTLEESDEVNTDKEKNFIASIFSTLTGSSK